MSSSTDAYRSERSLYREEQAVVKFRQQSFLPGEALHEPLYGLSHVNAATALGLQRLHPGVCLGVFFNESRVSALVFILIMHSLGIFFDHLSGHLDQNADFVRDHPDLLINVGKIAESFDPEMTGYKGFFFYFSPLIISVNEPLL